jgi:glycosyltransferase involved in cell wall biosynthesis
VLADLVGLPGVEVVGRVDSVDAALAMARVAVAPIRVGGGTRIKLIEAMAHGLPSVATSIGAEGLDVADGAELFVRDDVASYAAACVLLLRDDSLARSMGARARETYLARYRPEVGRRVVADVVERVMSRPAR